jgi:hypothetical protein
VKIGKWSSLGIKASSGGNCQHYTLSLKGPGSQVLTSNNLLDSIRQTKSQGRYGLWFFSLPSWMEEHG